MKFFAVLTLSVVALAFSGSALARFVPSDNYVTQQTEVVLRQHHIHYVATVCVNNSPLYPASHGAHWFCDIALSLAEEARTHVGELKFQVSVLRDGGLYWHFISAT